MTLEKIDSIDTKVDGIMSFRLIWLSFFLKLASVFSASVHLASFFEISPKKPAVDDIAQRNVYCALDLKWVFF